MSLSSIVVMALLQNSLFPKLYQTTTGHFASIVEPIARMFATLPCRSQIRGEGMVELPTEHLLFLGGRRHSRNQHYGSFGMLFFVVVKAGTASNVEDNSSSSGNQRSAIVLRGCLLLLLMSQTVCLPFRPGSIRRAICPCRACSSLLLRASETSL